MSLILKILKMKSRDIIAIMLSNLFIILFYKLFFKSSEILYPMLLAFVVFIVYLIIEIIRYKIFLERLNEVKKTSEYNDRDLCFNEEIVLDSISDIHKNYNKQIYSLEQNINERDKLFSVWIHNMKTSIAVIELASEKIKENYISKEIEDIKEENVLLKKNLNECLNVIRLNEFSNDYIFKKCNLKFIINKVINNKKRDFIYAGVYPQVQIDECLEIYTDEKWIIYMIEQIILNGIKYSNRNEKVFISAYKEKEDIFLLIEDKGIGIAKEDLSRVFNPFFTGTNGRNNRNSTGIGLYMVKNISNKLKHEVFIESEEEKGTVVTLKFKNINDTYTNLS
ncbi:sensor histidine kinase [uncultured Clostridium sp.]|uniref:sensor histidine kinase n=1 Tax=uncultured Clostridium sp. TaxID=59620 RepID=UPI00259106D9|nr:sensor histidine kinase [uncultured Clostridium sp.]